MATTASFTEVRDNLSEIVDQVVSTGEALTILRHSRPAAVILSVEEFESMVETLNILSDPDTMSALAEADDDIALGHIEADPD